MLDDPAGVAAALAEAEEGIRTASTPPARLTFLGQTQQAAYLRLVAHQDWVPAVLDRLPPGLRPVVNANSSALYDWWTLNGTMDRLPAWRIVAPPPAEDLLGYYREGEGAYGVSWTYLAAIHLIETNMSRIKGDSSAGARGPMQFLPSTWAVYGRGDIENTHDAILAAARYLRASGAPGNMQRAVYSYNPSQRYVRAVMRFAEQMQADARAFYGYHEWRVYVHTAGGDTLLDEGYPGSG